MRRTIMRYGVEGPTSCLAYPVSLSDVTYSFLCIITECMGIWHLTDRFNVPRGMIYADHAGSLRAREMAEHLHHPAADAYFNWSWIAYPDTEEIFYQPPKGIARDFDHAFSQIMYCIMAADFRTKGRLPAQGDLFDFR